MPWPPALGPDPCLVTACKRTGSAACLASGDRQARPCRNGWTRTCKPVPRGLAVPAFPGPWANSLARAWDRAAACFGSCANTRMPWICSCALLSCTSRSLQLYLCRNASSLQLRHRQLEAARPGPATAPLPCQPIWHHAAAFAAAAPRTLQLLPCPTLSVPRSCATMMSCIRSCALLPCIPRALQLAPATLAHLALCSCATVRVTGTFQLRPQQLRHTPCSCAHFAAHPALCSCATAGTPWIRSWAP